MCPESLPRFKLKPGEEDRLLGGHRWIFSNEIEAAPKDVPAGAIAAAFTSRDTPLGVGFYNPHSLIAWRLVSKQPEAIDESFIERRLKAAIDYRARVYPEAMSYRLFFGESDGLPGLVIDRYQDICVLQVLSAGAELLLDPIVASLKKLLSPKGIYVNNDHGARKLEGLSGESRVLDGAVPPTVVIEDDGLSFEVPITQGQKTGYYFDQRDNRRRLAPYMKGRNVLDLYCYLGSFGLFAARSGAAKVLGLDSSEPAAALAQANAKRNRLDKVCEFDSGDAEEVLAAFAQTRQEFQPDVILLDPPSFAPSKKHVMKALRAHAKLNSLALKALPKGGLLATSTCSHHIGYQEFMEALRQGAARYGRSVRVLERGAQAKDHPILLAMPETEYLHFALVEVI